MTFDVPPMDPCPVTKTGKHNLAVITLGEDDGDITLSCHICGAIRRVPAKGAIAIPLDDMPTWAIIRAAQQ
jgi:hypothetical protein